MPPADPAAADRRPADWPIRARAWSWSIGAALLAAAIAGCGLVGAEPPPESRMDSSSLVALLPTAFADRVFDVGGVRPRDLVANVDPPYLAQLRTVAERHGRTLADLQVAAANGQDGQPTVSVFAVRIHGVPAEETAILFFWNPDPSAPPTPSPRPTTIAGHPVLITEPGPEDHYTILFRDEIVFSISAPDTASMEATVQALWSATAPSAAPSPSPGPA